MRDVNLSPKIWGAHINLLSDEERLGLLNHNKIARSSLKEILLKLGKNIDKRNDSSVEKEEREFDVQIEIQALVYKDIIVKASSIEEAKEIAESRFDEVCEDIDLNYHAEVCISGLEEH